MQLPSVKDLPVAGKRVLVRVDLDVPIKVERKADGIWYQVTDDTRLRKSKKTVKFLLKNHVKQVILIGHFGRPEEEGGSVFSIWGLLDAIYGTRVMSYLQAGYQTDEVAKIIEDDEDFDYKIILLENLRFWPGEEKNDPEFAKNLASLADFYVNEAFAVSHRKHASIVGIPKFLPSAFGFSFLEEVEVLSKVKDNPARPVTLILGGAKEDKLGGVEKLAKWADNILIGGRLPKLDTEILRYKDTKIIIAKLNSEGKDISGESIEIFKQLIMQSRTVVWAGPMGVYEEEKNASGTHEVAQAIVESGAFSVVGGGDTETALKKLRFDGKMNYISSGGGAMLEMLANGTLPGIEAIKHGKSSH